MIPLDIVCSAINTSVRCLLFLGTIVNASLGQAYAAFQQELPFCIRQLEKSVSDLYTNSMGTESEPQTKVGKLAGVSL